MSMHFFYVYLVKYLEHIDRSRHLYCHNQYKSDNLQINFLSNQCTEVVQHFRKLIIYIFYWHIFMK